MIEQPKKKKRRNGTKKFDGLEMFAYYVSLGHTRSFQQVADKFGCSYPTIGKLSIKHKWFDRISDIEKRAQEEVSNDLINKMVIEKKAVRMIQKNALIQASRKMANSKRIPDLRDCKIAYELARTEQGLPTKYTHESVDDITDKVDQLPEDEITKIRIAAEANGLDEFKDSLDKDEI